MHYRFLLLAVVLLLSGCSSFSQFSWSDLSPFNWFSSALEVTEKGVGDITATTQMDNEAINNALDNNYKIRSGMATRQGEIIAFYQAMEGGDVRLAITGQPNSYVEQVEVMDPDITAGKAKIGMPFSAFYQRAFNYCRKSTRDDKEGVECRAPDSNHISYFFTGNWRGPAGLMPDDAALRNWTLNRIIWRTRMQ